MFDLVYNIDFEIAAFLFAVLLYIETSVCYPRHTRKNKIFRIMALMVIVTDSFDILSAFTITYGAAIPATLNLIVSSGYFMSGLALCFMLHYYVQNAVIPPDGKPFLIKTNQVILIAAEASMLLNACFGFYFSFSKAGAYVHGPLYLCMHLMSLWFVVCASATLFINRKLLKRTQIISSFLFVLLYFAAVVLQTFFFPDILIIMPAVSAMLIIAIFSLESPDFAHLQLTLHELTETKRALEKANEKYYSLAYTDLMTGLKNRTAYHIRLEQLGAAPFKERVIILIADINNLKQLNDHFGHIVGDDAIVKTAKLLQQNFTDGCQCYRVGGDEFAVIAYDMEEADFIRNFARFTEETEAENAGSQYPFSIAAGYQRVGALPLLEALKAADKNMYENKVSSKRFLKNQTPR